MARTILSVGLLAFVAVALITVVVRGRGGPAGAPPATMAAGASASAGAAVSASSPAAAARLVAFYFHGSKRCTSCNSIERLTREALKAETDAGTIEIRSVNLDEAADAHFVEDFQLTMRTVVLAEEAGGRIVRWKRLDQCWDRFGDPPDYLAYVRRNVAAFREPATAAP